MSFRQHVEYLAKYGEDEDFIAFAQMVLNSAEYTLLSMKQFLPEPKNIGGAPIYSTIVQTWWTWITALPKPTRIVGYRVMLDYIKTHPRDREWREYTDILKKSVGFVEPKRVKPVEKRDNLYFAEVRENALKKKLEIEQNRQYLNETWKGYDNE
jgi:hypothetical protein